MKNKKIFKTLSALCAALVLMMGLSVTAFAQGTEELPAEDATNDSNVVVEETEDSPALTPDGNAALVDEPACRRHRPRRCRRYPPPAPRRWWTGGSKF